jgi:hypothetical protein
MLASGEVQYDEIASVQICFREHFVSSTLPG